MNFWANMAKKYKLKSTGNTAKINAALLKAKVKPADLSPKGKVNITVKKLKGVKKPPKRNKVKIV